jgi:hypothetical protein
MEKDDGLPRAGFMVVNGVPLYLDRPSVRDHLLEREVLVSPHGTLADRLQAGEADRNESENRKELHS